MEKDYVKKLAELKKELVTRKQDIEKELELINLNLKLIDKALSESSFVSADKLLEKSEEEKEEKIIRTDKVLDIDGYLLTTLNFYDKKIEVIPNSELKFKEDISPFKNFLVKKVFEGKKSSDIERGKSENECFNYEIIKDENENVTNIILKNVKINEQQEVKNLINSIKWTMKRIREKLESI